MNDCVNAEFRDQLPALLHERLGGDERVALVAHLADCGDCRDELELLRALNSMFADATPRMDTAAIVTALPAAPLPAGVLPFRQRVVRGASRRMDWRVAAAIGVLAVGGSSLALTHHVPIGTQSVVGATAAATAGAASRTVASAAGPASSGSMAGRTASAAAVTSPTDAELSMTGRLDDLSADQLQTLLGEIDNLQATPMTDPTPVVVPVTLTSDGGPPAV
jgi:hypothetical protein